jgi:hypothetical protein
MPEPTPVPTPPAAVSAPVPPSGTFQVEGATPPPANIDEPLGAPGLRALQAERERAAAAEAELAAAKAKVAQFEQANQTDLEREKARADAAEAQLATEKTQRLRLEVAAQHGIPAAHMVLLTATDEAGLKAQAEQVAALVAAQAAVPATPTPLPGQGTPPAPPTATVASGAALYAQKKQKT